MASPKSVEVVDIILTTTLQDIPAQGPPCFVEGLPTERVFLEHTASGIKGLEIRAMNVAGYRCSQCGSAFYSNQGSMEFLSMASQVLSSRGDQTGSEILSAAAERHRQIITEENLAQPRPL